MTKKELSEAANAMARRGNQTKLEKLVLEGIARENRKLGGRPSDAQKKQETN